MGNRDDDRRRGGSMERDEDRFYMRRERIQGDLERGREWGDREFGNARGYGDEDWDRPRNLGARDYETRHFGGGRGGFDRGYSMSGMQGSFGQGNYRGMQGMHGRQPEVPGWGRGMGGSDLGMGERMGEHDMDRDRGPFYGKGPKGYRRSDERIREDVCECIHMQGHIDASEVEIKVENGVVTMTGTIPERRQKRMLEHMVERVRGVDDVRNELRLTKREEERRTPTDGNRMPQSQHPNGKNVRSS